ncbi:MAG: hypothetical protein QXJ13_04515 [Candidatus Bathyarchaeia archaeon]
MSIADYINDVPLIDVHTHINFRKPTAINPMQIMLYHYIATELRSLGFPVDEIIAKSADPVSELIQHFKLIRNTATYWCLNRILSDLYDFHEDLSPSSWPKLKEEMELEALNGGWANKIRDKIKVARIFLTINPLTEPKPEFDKSLYVASLRLDPFVSGLSGESIRRLEKIYGEQVLNLDKLRDILASIFEAYKGYSASAAVSMQSFEIYKPTHTGLAEAAYGKLYSGKPISEAEMMRLRSAALSTILDLCREHNLPIQLMVGVVRDLPGASPPDLAVCFKQRGLKYLCYFFHQYRDVDFHIISAYRFQSHELTVMAKNYPNVYMDGYWWYCFFPESISQHLLERIQILPAGKTCGFFSDAYVLEWIYGKAALARKVTAEALENMVKRGFYTIETAKEIANQILWENAARLFKIQ